MFPTDRSANATVAAAPSQNPVLEDPFAGSDPESVAGILPHRLSFYLLPCDDASRPVFFVLNGRDVQLVLTHAEGVLLGYGATPPSSWR